MSSSFFSSTASFFIVLLYLGACHISDGAQQSTYIVHMAKSQMPSSFDQHSLWYESSLRSVSESAELLYTYNSAIHGFSTRLTPEEADSLMTHPGVISVLPEKRHELDTTGLHISSSGRTQRRPIPQNHRCIQRHRRWSFRLRCLAREQKALTMKDTVPSRLHGKADATLRTNFTAAL
ncbi:unnamed protein product [Brassica napus]|uniref:(rape) hypothetical protein n=1 Tax=Brassica napus TaxID=3708 RepID=A0A816NJV8_BRANA|nr:unnamed protein product [Brassica napus]